MEKEWLHVVITGSSINDDIINSDYFIKLLDDNKLRFLKDVDKTGYGLIYETTLTSGRKNWGKSKTAVRVISVLPKIQPNHFLNINHKQYYLDKITQ